MSEPIHPGALSCKEIVSLITEYLDDALSPGTRERFELHIRECSSCRAFLAQMKSTIATLRRSEPIAISNDAVAEFRKALDSWKDDPLS